MAITIPFHYSEIVNDFRGRLSIGVVWTLAVCWSLLGLIKWDGKNGVNLDSKRCKNENYVYYSTSFFGVYIPSLLVMTCIYLKILHVAIKHINAIEASKPKHNQSLALNGEKPKKTEKTKFSKELKATKSLAFVYLAFVVCWFPSCVISAIILDNPYYFPELKREKLALFNFLYYFFVDILPIINTMVNPFIYSFSNKLFLQAFKRVIYKVTGGLVFKLNQSNRSFIAKQSHSDTLNI